MNAPTTRLEAHEAHKARRMRMAAYAPKLIATGSATAPVIVAVEPPLPMVRAPEPPKPWVPRTRSDRIVAAVAARHGLTAEQVRGRHAGRNVSWTRQVAVTLLVRVAGRTLVQAATAVGRVEHTTALYAMRSVDRRVAEDPVAAADFEELAGMVRDMCRG